MNEEIALRQLKALAEQSKHMRLAAEEWKNDYETLVSTIMSARTRDEVTIPIAAKLFEKYPTPETLAKASEKKVQEIIKPVNFYRNKTKNIIACSKCLIENFNGVVPHDIDSLLTLPGVGRKTANVFLIENEKHAIPVDTHVFYISRKLGWAKENHPHKVEEELKKLFVKTHWKEVNPILVRFGKTFTSRKQKDELLEKISKIK